MARKDLGRKMHGNRSQKERKVSISRLLTEIEFEIDHLLIIIIIRSTTTSENVQKITVTYDPVTSKVLISANNCNYFLI